MDDSISFPLVEILAEQKHSIHVKLLRPSGRFSTVWLHKKNTKIMRTGKKNKEQLFIRILYARAEKLRLINYYDGDTITPTAVHQG